MKLVPYAYAYITHPLSFTTLIKVLGRLIPIILALH